MASPRYTLRRVGATATPTQGIALANQLRPFFVGGVGAPSADPGNILTTDDDGRPIVTEQAVRSIAADQDTVLVYDFDALVSANLGV